MCVFIFVCAFVFLCFFFFESVIWKVAADLEGGGCEKDEGLEFMDCDSCSSSECDSDGWDTCSECSSGCAISQEDLSDWPIHNPVTQLVDGNDGAGRCSPIVVDRLSKNMDAGWLKRAESIKDLASDLHKFVVDKKVDECIKSMQENNTWDEKPLRQYDAEVDNIFKKHLPSSDFSIQVDQPFRLSLLRSLAILTNDEDVAMLDILIDEGGV